MIDSVNVRDPYKSKQLYNKWAENKEIKDVNKIHSKLIIGFIDDMALGLNIAKGSPKGARSYKRLNSIRSKLTVLTKLLERKGIKDVRKATGKDMVKLFDDMRKGAIVNKQGKNYKCTGDYIKNFKTFWHWYQRIEKNKDNKVQDITEDLDTRGEKPKFVYFTKEDFERILAKAEPDLKPLLAVAFDSGGRTTELLNIKVNDFSDDFKKLNIREETSKTFGRKINLMMCSEQIKAYIKKSSLKGEDYLCNISPEMVNRKLRSLGKLCLTPEQTKFKNLTLYDFRHSSACHWLPIYKSESALKWRFGWKKSEMIHYYTEFLGMKDTICEDDLYIDITKTELEKKMSKIDKENNKLKTEVGILQRKEDRNFDFMVKLMSQSSYNKKR